MKRILGVIMCAILGMGILTGCGFLSNSSARNPLMDQTVEISPTGTQGEPVTLGGLSETPRDTDIVIHMESDALAVSYVLTAVNPYADFTDGEAVINYQGAEALVRWLLHPDNLTAISEFGGETYGETVFTVPETVQAYSGWISSANDSTKTVRLMTTSRLEQSGLLQNLLPQFEESYGYSVDVTVMEADAGYASAMLGEADLLLMEAPEKGDNFAEGEYFRQIPGLPRHVPLMNCPYVLCGPREDPAGTAACGDVPAALDAIAEGGYLFVSRGDGSADHRAELSLWPEQWQTRDESWYFSVDTEMGPCITIAEEMGGYVLSDKLTYLIFNSLHGII